MEKLGIGVLYLEFSQIGCFEFRILTPLYLSLRRGSPLKGSEAINSEFLREKDKLNESNIDV